MRLWTLGLLLLLPFASPARAQLSSERILTGLDEPVFVAAPEGDPRLFVVLRRGVIRIFRPGSGLAPQPFLDIDAKVNDQGEGGLLGLAFAPDYASTRAFYVYYTATGASHPFVSRISRFRAVQGTPDLADPTEKILLELDQPFDNHNGGTVAFGDDGYLYMGFGDGGDADDPLEASQDGTTLLGKMIRLDVSFLDFEAGYTIPPDNPFLGPDGVRDEIWAFGLRNPFRFSFDREGGALYIGDVGQSTREEIDVEPPAGPGFSGGRNYGWDVMEGDLCFSEPPDPGEPDCDDPALDLPVHVYGHSDLRCSVTGGVVYRGSALELQGHYLFADYCSWEIWSFRWDGGGGITDLVERTDELDPDPGAINDPVAFGEDGNGEVYVVDKGGDVFLIVPEPGGALLTLAGVALLALAALLGTGRPAAGAVATTRVLSGLDQPLFVTAPPGDARTFVVLRGGEIRIYRPGIGLQAPPFLDISSQVDALGEGGLLGLAFPPDFAATRGFYVFYTTTGPSGQFPLTTKISRFQAEAGAPDLANPTEKELLSLDGPSDNHKGATLAFGADGYLYVALGDGSDGNDPLDAGQDATLLFGKMLRLDVSFTDLTDDYAIPPDNPFAGDDGRLDEIWALGFRNPFRFSFDRQGGALYLGDVGQEMREEIDVEPPAGPANPGGRNYGWDVMEGSVCSSEPPGPGEPPCNDPGLRLPVHDYPHTDERCSVTGGVVYRGSATDLTGQYLFADYCSSQIWSFEWDGDDGITGLVERTEALAPDQGSIDQVVAFGEDAAGEVYVVDRDGEIFQIVPEPGAARLLVAGAAVLICMSLSRRGT